MSPQSSQTLLRVRQNRSKSRDNAKSDDSDRDSDRDDRADDRADDKDSSAPRRRFRKRRRSNSDPSSDRPDVARRRDGNATEPDRPSSSGDEVELLPDRFDAQGRLVAGPRERQSSLPSRSRRGDKGWTERKGDFEYRSPKPGGAQARGAWSVGGTDPDQVERLMRDVTDLIGDGPPKGVGGWLGLAGRLLGSGLLGSGGLPGLGDDASEVDDDVDDRRGGSGNGIGNGTGARGVGRIGYGGPSSEISRDERGKGRRRPDDHEYNDDVDYDDEEGGTRRRRRRRRREVD